MLENHKMDEAADYIEELERQLAEAHKTATHDKGMFEVRLGSARTKTEIERAARAQAEAEVAVLRGHIEHIAEYWNGSRTDGAMADALDHIEGVCAEALSTAPERAKLINDVVEAARYFKEVWGVENAHVVIRAHTKLRLAFKALAALDQGNGGGA